MPILPKLFPDPETLDRCPSRSELAMAPPTIGDPRAGEAAQNGVSVTPALRLRDRETGKSLLLNGPVEGDALLSAIDLLSAGGPQAGESSSSPDMPAAPVGDMPR